MKGVSAISRAVVLVSVLVGASGQLGYSQQSASNKEAGARWSLTFSVGQLPGETNPAAILVSNRAVIDGGPVVKTSGLKNESTKTISSVRIGWLMYREADPSTIIGQGATGPIGVTDFAPGTVAKVDYPVVHVVDAIAPKVKEADLSGAYRIVLAVVHAQFTDGTEWSQKLPMPVVTSTRPN